MKKLFVLLLALVMMMSFTLTSCNKNDECDEHVDATGDGLCDKCDEKMPAGNDPDKNPDEDPNACKHENGTLICEDCFAPVIDFGEFTAPDFETIGVKLSDFVVEMEDEDIPTNSGRMTIEVAEAYVSLAGLLEGELDGYGTATIVFVNDNIAGYRNELNAQVFFEGTTIYYIAEGTTPGSSTEKTDVCGSVDIAKAMNNSNLNMSSAAGMLSTVTELAPEVVEWLTDTLAPVFADVKVDGVVNAYNKYSAKLINSFFTKTVDKSTGAITIAYDLAFLEDWAETVVDSTVAELIDAIAGEGKFDELYKLLNGDDLYNFSVADLIEYIEDEQGIDLDELVAAIDDLLALVTGSDEMTLDSMLEAYTGMTVDAILSNEELLALDVKYAIAMAMGTEDADAAVEQIKTMLFDDEQGIFPMLEENTALELVATFTGEEIDEDMIFDTIEQITGMVSEIVTYEITADKNGKLTKLELDADVSGMVPGVDEIALNVTVEDGETTLTVTVDSEEGTVDAVVTASADGVNVNVELEIPSQNAFFKIDLDVIPDYTVEKDEDTLDYIKDTVADVDAGAAFLAYGENSSYRKIIDDAANDQYIVYEVRSSGTFDSTTLRVYLQVSYVPYDAFMLYNVAAGCGSCVGYDISYTYEYNYGYAYVTVADTNIYYSNEDILDLIDEDTEISFDYDESFSSTSGFSIVYDTANDTYDSDNYDYGHDYYYDEDKSTTADECLGIYKDVYTCANCHDSYTRYDTIEHEKELSATGSYGYYEIYADCVNEGCDLASERVGSINLDNYLSVEYVELPGYASNEIFAFEYTSDSYEYVRFYLDANRNELDEITVYCYRDGYYYDNIYCYAESSSDSIWMEEDTTYLFIVCINDWAVNDTFDASVEFGWAY